MCSRRLSPFLFVLVPDLDVLLDLCPCALARLRSSLCGVGARSDGWNLGVRLRKSAAGMVELGSSWSKGCRPCPPYPCQVDRMTADPSMPTSGRLPRVGSTTLAGQLSGGARTWRAVVRGHEDVAARSIFAISFPPPKEDLLEVPN
ncbi:hypothetical protein BHE74_00031166 [Ensete ventricosum]|nr:hypothetical protein BHE74_00031166 [Ensete ventricosum]